MDESKIVVFYDADGQFATAWKNKDDLQFKWDEQQSKFVDQTGRTWNMMLGAPDGKEETAEKLASIPATVWLMDRWKGFYPESRVFEANAAETESE